MLTLKETVHRHHHLHKAMDELFACYITQNPMTAEHGKYTEMPFKRLLEWSSDMRWNPTCHPKHEDSGFQSYIDRTYAAGRHNGFWLGVFMGLVVGMVAGIGLPLL